MRWSELPEWRTLRDGGRPLAERAGYLPAGTWLHERCHELWAPRPAAELLAAAGLAGRAQGDLLVEGEPEAAADAAAPAEFATPDVHTIPDLAAFTGLGRERLAKSVVTMAGGLEPVLCLVRGDHQLDEAKLARHLGVDALRGATADEIAAAFGAEPGSLGPVGVKGCRVVVDLALAGATGLVTGANRTGFHLRHVTPERDFACEFADLRKGGRTRVFADADGLRMTEFLEAAIARHQDAAGVRLPVALAPFAVVVTLVNPADEQQRAAAEQVYGELRAAGVETVLDDRAERAGVKFADAELIGFPVRITAGKNVRDGMLEIVDRATRTPVNVPVAEAAATVARLVRHG
ncbi:MAG: hypothetical protein IT162_08460 [Bryobacterales bacterium]|nr:hypothetical protein [Bryobacterales bacterium]